MRFRLLIFLLLLALPAHAMQPMSLWEYQQFKETLEKIDGCLDTTVDENGVTHVWLRLRYKIVTSVYVEKYDSHDWTPLLLRNFTLGELLSNTKFLDSYEKGCWK